MSETKRRVSRLEDVAAIRAYLQRIGAQSRSFRTAVVQEKFGNYWKDIETIRFFEDGGVVTSDDYMPTSIEEDAIKAECVLIEWPKTRKIPNYPVHSTLPNMIKNAKTEDLYYFRNIQNEIIMIQVRIVGDDGEKRYIPWTWWTDDTWRTLEPDGDLPVFNAELIGHASLVFIHEGAKAARAAQRIGHPRDYEEAVISTAHPWHEDLKLGVHIGWIGGARNPHRTNWGFLRELGVKRVIIVADNDEPGRAAVPQISKAVKLPAIMINFGGDFPEKFDLADEFPEDKLFEKDSDGLSYYRGPKFSECLQPATWATEEIIVPNQKKPIYVLRDCFKNVWTHINSHDAYVCSELPGKVFSEKEFNTFVRAFSHVKDTTDLIHRTYKPRTFNLTYAPDRKELSFNDPTGAAYNLHVPTRLTPIKGDASPFIEYLKYMVPDEDERYQVMRWLATLIARPEIKMGYALLLVSETQGIGKSTLGEFILQPILGPSNVSFPGENLIMSDFNSWIANKRLVFVHEIYSGHSWKMYNKLQSFITDLTLSVNEKFEKPYITKNWAHFIACSNAEVPIKITETDRRWFYPKLNENKWPSEKFVEFRRWLRTGGLEKIMGWAQSFNEIVQPYERAPITEKKIELIENSRSDAAIEAFRYAKTMMSLGKPAAISLNNIYKILQAKYSNMFESKLTIRKIFEKCEIVKYDRQIFINHITDYAMMNRELASMIKEIQDQKTQISLIRQCLANNDWISEKNDNIIVGVPFGEKRPVFDT